MNSFQKEFQEIKSYPFQKQYEWVRDNLRVGDVWENNKSKIKVTIAGVDIREVYLRRERGKESQIQIHYFASDYSPVMRKEEANKTTKGFL
jgi:hypothetical protein